MNSPIILATPRANLQVTGLPFEGLTYSWQCDDTAAVDLGFSGIVPCARLEVKRTLPVPQTINVTCYIIFDGVTILTVMQAFVLLPAIDLNRVRIEVMDAAEPQRISASGFEV